MVKTYDQILEEMDALEQSSPEEFDKKLDWYEENDPETYERLLEDFGIEEEGDEADEQQPEEAKQ